MSEVWRNRLRDLLLIASGILLGYFAIQSLFFILFPIGLAWVFSEAIRKSFRRLVPLSPVVKRILIVLVLLIFFALISLVAVLLADRLIHALSEAAEGLGRQSDEIFSFLNQGTKKAEDFLERLLQKDISAPLAERIPGIFSSWLNRFLELIPGWIGHVINFIPKFFVSFLIFLISTYYFSCDWETFARFAKKHLSPERGEKISRFKRKFFFSLYRYLKAYGLLFLLTFAQLFLGLTVLGVEGAGGKAFFVALVDVLPILGSGTVLIPWLIFSFFTGKATLGWGLLILYLVITFLRQIAEPKIVGSSIGIHPVLSLVLVIAGLYFFGFFGMILLPLLGACLSESAEQ